MSKKAIITNKDISNAALEVFNKEFAKINKNGKSTSAIEAKAKRAVLEKYDLADIANSVLDSQIHAQCNAIAHGLQRCWGRWNPS